MSSVKGKRLQVLTAEPLKRFPWLVHGFSTRGGGCSSAYGRNALNLGFTADDSIENVERNRIKFLQSLPAMDRNRRPWPLVSLRQVHSDLIHRVTETGDLPRVGDGLVSDRAGVLLGIQTADCLGIILVDRQKRVIGAFHAGWRGTVKRIAEKGVGEMRRLYGARPGDILAVIGPGIHRCCYAVGEEVRDKFRSQFPYADDLFHESKQSDPIRQRYPLLFLTARPPGRSQLPRKLFLDLLEANRRQLVEAGVAGENITAFELCTSCRSDLLFSFRREQARTGRMLAVVGMHKRE